MIGEGSQESVSNDDSNEHALNLLERARHYLPIPNVDVAPMGIGYRPMPADGLPIVGFSDQVPNMYIAVTHSGVTLSPVLGTYASMEILDEQKVDYLENYRLERFLDGEGETKVQIDMGEDYKPEFSIVTVRPISKHHSVDATFVQLQLNEQKIRGKGRLSTNIGIGYRKLSENKDSITGANVFLDYDEEGNARASIGLELKSSSFDILANYYAAISGAKTVGAYTERTLDGLELTAVGQVPYLPWANLVATHYEWEAEKNSKDSILLTAI